MGLHLEAYLRTNPKLAKGKAKAYTTGFPNGSAIGSALDAGEEGEAKITFSSPPTGLRSLCSCINFI